MTNSSLLFTSEGLSETLTTEGSADTTTSHSHQVKPHSDDIVLWFLLNIISSIFILFTNSLTIIAVAVTPALRTQPNMYIVSLASADILTGFYLLLEAAWTIPLSGDFFDTHREVCLLKYSVLYLSLLASMMTVISITVDKLLFLGTPFLHRRVITREITLVIIVISWIISFLYASTVHFVDIFDESVGCQIYNVLNQDFVFFGNTAPVALVIIVTAVCYLEIIRIVAHQRRKIRAVNQLTEECNGSYQKSVRLFLTVIGVFVLCWCPFVICGFVSYICCKDRNMHKSLLHLALLNSGLNFFIYALKNKEFKVAFRRLLFGKCKPQESLNI